jgi:hypothetical protein
MVAGALLSSGVARAEQDGAWATQYGMLFSVQNIFQNNSASTLGDFGGGVGLQYNLAPQRAVRLQVSLSRASNDSAEAKTTYYPSNVTVTDFVAPGQRVENGVIVGNPTFSSRYDVGVGATYMMRLTTAAISPYLGVGAGFGYSQEALKYEDDVTTGRDENLSVDNMTREFALGGQGVLGLEWRLHKSIAIFAEYALDLNLVRYESMNFDSKTTAVTTFGSTGGVKSEGSKTTFFNFDTGLGQGGLIGVAAFF